MALASAIFGCPPENLRVLLVGFCSFKGDTETTWSTSARLEAPLRDFLVKQRGVPAKNVVCLEDAAGTRDATLAAAKALAKTCGPKETFFLFYGSHGSLARSGDATSYRLSAFDGHISGKEMVETICEGWGGGGAGAGRIVVITDTCYSGSMNVCLRTFARPKGFRVAALSSTSCFQTVILQ